MAFNGSHAVLLAAKYCKQYPLFQWREEALPEIGHRIDKFCFRVDLANLLQEASCGEMLLVLFPVQHSFLDFQRENTLYKLKSLLVTLKHPYLLPVVEVFFSKEKKALLVVQPFAKSGSLKDRIHRVSCPTRAYSEKYKLYKASPLPGMEVAKFGKQILLALQALRSKGIVCDHLSSGNVVIDAQGNARIAELYTPLLAIDRHRKSRDLTVPLEAKVDVDVLLFGHLLYEMATGMELTTTTPSTNVLALLIPEICEVLTWIFCPGTAKISSDGEEEEDQEEEEMEDDTTSTTSSNSFCFLTSVDHLLAFPLFANATDVPPISSLFSGFRLDSSMKSTVRHSMKINASRNHAYVVHHKEKEALAKARQRAERRVHDERDKQEKRAHQQLLASRGIGAGVAPLDASAAESKANSRRKKSYRATSFKSPLDRQLSSNSATSISDGGSTTTTTTTTTA